MTGTDTGVGKTAVAAGILAVLREEGLRAAPFKPVESGHDGPEGSWPPDARALHAASGLALRRDEVVPYVLREPLAPLVGARRDGVRIDLPRLDHAFADLERRFDLVIVEGAGGLAVPVDKETSMADLAKRWDLPVLIVARAGLGSINHTVLTVEYARSKGLHVTGVVVNGYPPDPGVAEETNPAVIRGMTGVPVLGILGWRSEVDIEAGRWVGMADEVRRRMDLGPVRGLLEAEA